ncbi:MAG: hypothetical protein P8J74_06145 [Woeseiaceae bacterium]|nr:hypothetical protein [Woeseiaceae bacterium]
MKKIILILTGIVLSFSVMADDHKSLRKDPQSRNFFKMMDLDQDGKVSYEEHEAFVAMQADKGRERFNSMDANSDGYVTKEEAKEVRKTLKKRMKEFFKGKDRRDKEEAAKD